jgi:hypothetical protein
MRKKKKKELPYGVSKGPWPMGLKFTGQGYFCKLRHTHGLSLREAQQQHADAVDS